MEHQILIPLDEIRLVAGGTFPKGSSLTATCTITPDTVHVTIVCNLCGKEVYSDRLSRTSSGAAVDGALAALDTDTHLVLEHGAISQIKGGTHATRT